jgi:hypothetical protein
MNPLLIIILTLIGIACVALFVGFAVMPTYKVTYAPENSRSTAPIQDYRIVGHPRKLAWRSHSGHRLFTALSAANHERYIAFRADRVLSINFAGFTLLSPRTRVKVASLLDKSATAKPVTA